MPAAKRLERYRNQYLQAFDACLSFCCRRPLRLPFSTSCVGKTSVRYAPNPPRQTSRQTDGIQGRVEGGIGAPGFAGSGLRLPRRRTRPRQASPPEGPCLLGLRSRGGFCPRRWHAQAGPCPAYEARLLTWKKGRGGPAVLPTTAGLARWSTVPAGSATGRRPTRSCSKGNSPNLAPRRVSGQDGCRVT